MKKVSIVIPVWNGEKTLELCYKSILAQTYQNFEVLTINDGSQDGTLEIMQKYAKKDKRFVAISVENGGVSRARNIGMQHATGEYLQFMDADDTLNPLMVEKMVNLLEKNDADLAICRFNHPFFKTYYEDEVFDLARTSDLLRLYQDPFGLVMPWNKIWRRDKFTEGYDVDEKFSEDELGNLANLPNLRRVVTTSEVLYNYFSPQMGDPMLLNSCIGRLIMSVAQGKKRASFYWLGAKLLPKRKMIIEKGIYDNKLAIDDVSDLCFYRLIDYSVYTLHAYIGMGISKNSISRDYLDILQDENFIAGFKAQEKYGFKLKAMSKFKRMLLVEKFIRLCAKTNEEKGKDPNFKILFAYMSIFLSLFATQTSLLNPINLNAKLLLDLKNEQTREAKYVKGIMKNGFVFDNNSFVFGDNNNLQPAFYIN